MLKVNDLPWTLCGWSPYAWEAVMTMETQASHHPEIGPVPMLVPGSVQQALLDAGIIPDWNDGLNSRAGEWVENRHWSMETTIPAGVLAGPGPHWLRLDGIDGSATIILGHRVLGRVASTFHPHRFELPSTDTAQILRVVFGDQPRALGQIGRTSQIHDWKSRYPYGWDWTPRIAQIGPWESIVIESGPQLDRLRAVTDLLGGNGLVTAHWQSASDGWVSLKLLDPAGTAVAMMTVPAEVGTATLTVDHVAIWWPNGHGAQPLYTLEVTWSTSGFEPVQTSLLLGFRSLTWAPCRGAPSGARDWICTVNGMPVFMQGANWVPLRTCFADVRDEEYRSRLETYRDLGFNLLRVWGGSVLEREVFYRRCDELGLMVWQEFPLSSSGIDNHPPDDPVLVEDMRRIAAHYVTTRQHHPSLILWCGGNELQRNHDGGSGCGAPCDEREPMLAAQAAVCAALDPGRRYVPASSSGPRFYAEASEFGKGLHHDVHGPWGHHGDLSSWRAYWDRDDSLLRSEVGFPGAQPEDVMRRHAGLAAWPPNRDNPYWVHTSSWWITWNDWCRERPEGGGLSAFIAWSQARQADAMAYAAATCKRRFPACGGFIVWMGHDCFPCPSNTAVIDVLGRPKPAALALARVFAMKEVQ